MSGTTRIRAVTGKRGDEGFMLLAVIVMIFLLLLTLSIAAPKIAREIQRDREQESQHRADQYVRAIRIYYLKFKRYPTSVEMLEKSNNQRFLRQKYIDPLTGKDDWRLIHQGENQTQVKGFFGEDLPGLQTGLGSAAGLASGTGATTGGTAGASTTGGSAFNNSTPGAGGLGGSSAAGSAFGGSTPGAGTTGAGTTGSGTTGGTGIASQDATSFTGSGGGPIIGIGSSKTGEAMLVVNDQTTYETWEFLYDPRIEQLYAKANLLGGISSGSGTSSGFGNTPVGTPVGTPIGGNPATPGTGPGAGTTPGGTTPP